MDKEIPKNIIMRRSAKGWIVGIGSAAAVTAGLILLFSIFAPAVKSNDLISGTVDEGPLEVTVSASGRIVPSYEEIINSPVETCILNVFAQPGDSVHKGMPLLELDLEEEEVALGKLRDDRTVKEQELRQLKLNNRTELSDLEMRIEVNEANVSKLAMNVANERRLDSLGSGTGDRVREAETAYKTAVLELKQLRLRLANERQRAAAAETGQKLNIGSSDREIAQMEKTIHRGSIPAPRDGILTFIASGLGSRIGAGEKVAVVSDLSSFRIIGEIAEGNSSRIVIGTNVAVRINGARLTGKISNITPEAKQGIVSFVVTLDNPRDSRLRSGARAELNVSADFKSHVTRLPNGPYYKGSGTYRLFVYTADDELERRSAELGDCNREYVEVVSGLKPGDRVILNDMQSHQNKQRLKIKK